MGALNLLRVTQIQVDTVLTLRKKQESLRKKLSQIEEELRPLETSLIEYIQAGADLTQAGYAIAVETSMRRTPKWKEVLIDALGKEYAAGILDATVPNIYHHLVITLPGEKI